MQDSNDKKVKIKKIGHIFLFVLIFFLLVEFFSFGFECIGKNSQGRFQDRNTSITGIQLEDENSIEVLVLGDSESYTSISPMQLFEQTGATAYICGQSGQRILETYHALEIALQNQKPKVVMIETNTLFRQKSSTEEAASTAYENLQYNFSVFRYHNLWKLPFKGLRDNRADYKGFVIRDWSQPYTGGTYMKSSLKQREVSEYIEGYMEKIIDLCNENDIQLLLYSAPSPKNYNYAKHNGLQQFADKHDIDYLDMNLLTDELKIDWKTDTADKGDHLNLSGATKVTEYLSTYLSENYDLKDYRGTELGDKWDKLVEAYYETIEENSKLEI